MSDPNGKSVVVSRIGVIRGVGETVVGWVYDTSHGERLAQALRSMSLSDRSRIKVRLKGDALSGLVAFPNGGNPFPDLRVHYCLASEMQLSKYTPWKRPHD